MVCGEPVVRPVVWVAFSLQNGLVDPITRKIYRCAGYKVKTFSLQRGGRAAENTKKKHDFLVATKPGLPPSRAIPRFISSLEVMYLTLESLHGVVC